VLLFGDNDTYAIRDQRGPMKGIQGALEAEGFHVDIAATLPDDLSSYGQVWSIHALTGLEASVESRLVTFAQGGGSILLIGERSCCTAVNASDKRIIDQLVSFPTGGLKFGPSDLSGVNSINTNAIRGLAASPHVLTSFAPSASGSIDTAGLQKRNFLAFATSRYATIGAWDSTDLVGTGGRVALVMDINWPETGYGGGQSPAVAVNLATFLKVPGAKP